MEITKKVIQAAENLEISIRLAGAEREERYKAFIEHAKSVDAILSDIRDPAILDRIKSILSMNASGRIEAAAKDEMFHAEQLKKEAKELASLVNEWINKA